ncbi:MAG TPA: hypothetical protein PLL06_16100 [Acidobacteriota bacterium]|nr:hypothetical protein [Acidobacteriota bacterium]HMZ81225.1 hypothetical protein [Acidobacteriota bacterium]HNG92683.1 hypothetical protein [Acidobacteriota bacterium]
MYLFSTDLPDHKSHIYLQRHREQWKAYHHHLQQIAKKLRPATREFALAEWHYDPTDHRCPHDAWLEGITLREIAGDEDKQHRRLQLSIRLLGAYHDGYLELTYDGVISYCLDFPAIDLRSRPNQGHGDWLVDEIRFSDRGKVLHEIEWAHGPRWYIECDDICATWTGEA